MRRTSTSWHGAAAHRTACANHFTVHHPTAPRRIALYIGGEQQRRFAMDAHGGKLEGASIRIQRPSYSPHVNDDASSLTSTSIHLSPCFLLPSIRQCLSLSSPTALGCHAYAYSPPFIPPTDAAAAGTCSQPCAHTPCTRPRES